MKHIKILALALLTCTNAASVDYTKNGDNWGDSYAGCKGGTQSPIDLKTLGPRTSSKGDFFKFYSNLASRKITWSADKSTNYVNFNNSILILYPIIISTLIIGSTPLLSYYYLV